jgi:hypothetical protein
MILSQSPGRPRDAVSFPATAKQLVLSSTTPTSANAVRAGIVVVTEAVPWFVRVKVAGDGCMSSPSIPAQESGKGRPEPPPENAEKNGEGRKDDGCGKRVFTGKEIWGCDEGSRRTFNFCHERWWGCYWAGGCLEGISSEEMGIGDGFYIIS